MAVETGNFGAQNPSESPRETGISVDEVTQSKFGRWLSGAAEQSSDQQINVDTILKLMTIAIGAGSAEKYGAVLDKAAKTSGEDASIFWDFKGPQKAILEDGSVRMAAGVLKTQAAEYEDRSEPRVIFDHAAYTVLDVAGIKAPVVDLGSVKETEVYKMTPRFEISPKTDPVSEPMRDIRGSQPAGWTFTHEEYRQVIPPLSNDSVA